MAARRSTRRPSVFDEVLSEEEGFESRQSAASARWGDELVFDVTSWIGALAGKIPSL